MSRLATKTSKDKARPKSSEKLKVLKQKSNEQYRDAVSPIAVQENLMGEMGDDPSDRIVHYIQDETVKALLIDANNLKSQQIPHPPASKPKAKVMVRKTMPTSKLTDNKPKQKVFVAKPVPTVDLSDVKMDVPSAQDHIKSDSMLQPHHILGTMEDFQREAAKRGEKNRLLGHTEVDVTQPDGRNERHGKSDHIEDMLEDVHIDEKNALSNWERQMKERKKQQNYLSKKMHVSADMLVMNQSNTFRQIQEERSIIDRAIPSMDYGKGYRVGSEFWKQVESFGGDEKGISVTLSKTEKGFAPFVEHIGQPAHVQSEMGVTWEETSRMANVHYPWLKSGYLQQRKKQLQKVIDELDPHSPYIDGLEVVGRSITPFRAEESTLGSQGESEDEFEEGETLMETDENDNVRNPLESYDDVIPEPIFGPSLLINGQVAQWEGEMLGPEDQVGMTTRLMFEANVGEFAQGSIDMTNDGTTAIYYHWQKLPAVNPFNLNKSRPLQRFYFDSCDGIILPGVTVNLSFLFKSPNAGIFTEAWKLLTQPLLCGGARIEIILRGVATEMDDFIEERNKLERELELRQQKRMIDRIVNDIVRGVGTPPRPSTPSDEYLTEEDIFRQVNDKLHFRSETIDSLKEFYQQMQPEESWDLDVNSLFNNVLRLEDEENREEMLEKLNADVKQFVPKSQPTLGKISYDRCYQVLCEAVDHMVLESMKLRNFFQLPEKEFILKVDETQKKTKKSVPEMQTQTRQRIDSSRAKKDAPNSRGRNASTAKGKRGESPANGKGKNEQTEVEVAPEEVTKTEELDVDNPMYSKYLERLQIQTYSILTEMAAKLDTVLSQ